MQTEADATQRQAANWPESIGLLLAGWLCAWATLTCAGLWQSGTWPAAAAPFGLNRVLVAHLLGVLPLSLWTARWLARPSRHRLRVMGWWVGAGLLVAAGSLLAAASIRQAAAASTPGQCQAIRLAWAWLLLIPWSAAAVTSYISTIPLSDHAPGRSAAHPSPRSRPPRNPRRRALFVTDGVIAALLALLPAIHVRQVVERQSALVSDAAINQQYLRAWQLSQELLGLGTATIAGQPSRAVVDDLRATVDRLLQSVQAPLPPQATDPQKLSRASQLHSLGRFDEVEQVLQGLEDEPRAQLRLALSDEARRHYGAAAERYARTIELLSAAAPLDAEQLKLLRSAYERRVNNLRRTGQSRKAEAELLAGLEQWPAARDAFLLQLGFHYQMAGRTREAMDYFQQAADANPQLRPQAEAMLSQLRQLAEGCLLRPTRGATR